MARKVDMDRVARESAERIVEGYRKDGHKCKVCGGVFIPVHGCEEYNRKVKALLAVSEIGPDFQEGWIDFDGYCKNCRWDKFGVSLEVQVTMKVYREHDESLLQTINGLKAKLGQLGVPFSIDGYWEIR